MFDGREGRFIVTVRVKEIGHVQKSREPRLRATGTGARTNRKGRYPAPHEGKGSGP